MNSVEAALYSKLTGDAALTALLGGGANSVFGYLGPENATMPFVVFAEQTDVPAYTLKAKAYEQLLYLVKGVTKEGSMKVAGQIAERIEALLFDTTLTISGGTLMYCRKESGVRYVETDNGVRFNHAGGLYRLFTR